jgi:hypothetical protein
LFWCFGRQQAEYGLEENAHDELGADDVQPASRPFSKARSASDADSRDTSHYY